MSQMNSSMKAGMPVLRVNDAGMGQSCIRGMLQPTSRLRKEFAHPRRSQIEFNSLRNGKPELSILLLYHLKTNIVMNWNETIQQLYPTKGDGYMWKPMLSATVESIYNLKYPLLVSPKIDGIRCLVVGGVAS